MVRYDTRHANCWVRRNINGSRRFAIVLLHVGWGPISIVWEA